MKQRNSQGRFVEKHMTWIDRVIVLGLFTFTVSCGWTISNFTETQAVASDLPAGQPAVQNEIVSSSPVSLDDAKPLGESTTTATQATEITPDDMSVFISQAVQEFLPDHKSEGLMIMHCLAHRENGHAANRNCGDSGKACGPFQFHQPTWEGYRKLMIKEGLAADISDRYNKLEAARTTAWAISTGRSEAWGPLLRDKNGSDYASCQFPSWEK